MGTSYFNPGVGLKLASLNSSHARWRVRSYKSTVRKASVIYLSSYPLAVRAMQVSRRGRVGERETVNEAPMMLST